MSEETKVVDAIEEPTAGEMQRRQELVDETLKSGDYSFTFEFGKEVTYPEMHEQHRNLQLEAAFERAMKINVQKDELIAAMHSASVEKIQKIQKLSDENLRLTANLVRAEEDVTTAIRERNARVLDEAMRAQRVDVEALRHKVNEMKKNLATVDARADERFAARLREKDIACERRLAELLASERDGVKLVLATSKAAVDELLAVRAGEQARVEALNAALEAIWAYDKREKGSAGTVHGLVAELRQILSIGRTAAQ